MHIPISLAGPNIRLKIFVSKISEGLLFMKEREIERISNLQRHN
jgi:hypothetical protein